MTTWVKEYPGTAELYDHAADHGSWEPKAAAYREYPDVPGRIAAAAGEANACVSIDAYIAAIILARAVIEASAKHANAGGNDLYKKIDWLGEHRLIMPAIVAAAHEVRFIGNDMAHGDFAEAVTAEDAAEVMGIMDDVLEALSSGPARTKRLAEARARRRATDQQST